MKALGQFAYKCITKRLQEGSVTNDLFYHLASLAAAISRGLHPRLPNLPIEEYTARSTRVYAGRNPNNFFAAFARTFT